MCGKHHPTDPRPPPPLPRRKSISVVFFKSLTTRVCACHRICLFAAKTIHVQTGSATGGALHEYIQQGLGPHFHALAQSFTLLK